MRTSCIKYRNETSELLSNHFNAENVVCFDFRHRVHTTFEKGVVVDFNDPTNKEGPAIMAHSDHTHNSGLNVVNAHLSKEDKRRFLSAEYRIRLVNTWRSLLPLVEDQPLAFCDPFTVNPEDLVETDRIVADKLGAVYMMHYQQDQHWYWLHHQTSSEPFVFITWDSEAHGHAGYCPHISFVNGQERVGVAPRDSVETRSIVITRK